MCKLSSSHARFLSAVVGGVAVTSMIEIRFATAQCEQTKMRAPDGASGDNFSKSLAIEGAVAVIGSPYDDHAGSSAGSAYVYRRDGRAWLFEAKLTAGAGDSNDSDQFGTSVDLSNGVIVVGAPFDDEAASNAGATYVFRKVGGVWTKEQKLAASDSTADGFFGRSVALEGSLLIVGANLADTVQADEGAAYVFRYNGAQWIEDVKLAASDGDSLDYFGYHVSLSGDVALISAYLQDDRGVDAGIVYVFRVSEGNWIEETKLFGADTGPSDLFGQAIDIEGDRILVGAPGNNDSGPYTGSVYVFHYDGSGWTEEQKLLAPGGGSAQDIFGFAVGIEGNVVAVGEPGDDSIVGNGGIVYLYGFDGSAWSFVTDLTPSDPDFGKLFGSSLEMDGSFILGGAYGDNEFGTAAGAAYVDLLGAAAASWSNYGSGHPGTLGIPDLVVDGDPVMGTTIRALLDNSAGTQTFGLMMIGIQSASLVTNLGGTLLVIPNQVIPLQVPGPGMSLPLTITCNDILIGISVYLQVIEIDFGASEGASFTPGLNLMIGF